MIHSKKLLFEKQRENYNPDLAVRLKRADRVSEKS